jgi:hypothetical protein
VLTVAQLIAVTLIAGAATVFFSSAYQLLLPGEVDEADLTEGTPSCGAAARPPRSPGRGPAGCLPRRPAW